MNEGNFSISGKKERAKKFHISDKVGANPLVTIAKDESDAANIWAKRTKESIMEAVVTPIGGSGVPIARRANKESKPAAPALGKEIKNQ